MDPPYAPIDNKSFVGYNKEGFNFEQHIKLFNICNELNSKQIKFIMSNADVELITIHFPEDKYKKIIISCKRTINSKKPGSKCNEVLILS